MALTILSAPGNNSSVSNEMLFIIQESIKSNDPINYPNYKFVLDIYVGGDFKQRLKANPDPTNYFGIFNVAPILRSYQTEETLKANYSNQTEEYTIKTDYQVKLGEEYSDTLYTNLVTDSQRSFFKTYKTRPFTSSDLITGSPASIIASNIPSTSYGYREDKWCIIPFYTSATGIAITYGAVNSQSSTIDSDSIIATADKINQVNLSFQKVSSLLGLSQSQQDEVVYIYYDIDSLGSGRIYMQCSKHPILTLAWLNPYGGYESYSFGLVSKKTNEISRKEFAQLNYRINASGEVSYAADGVFYGGKRGYASNVKTTLRLTSHILTADEYTWLADLFNSPDVYLYNSTLDKFFPVTIRANNYEYRTYANSRLTPLDFDVEFADDYNAQFL